MTIQFSTRGPKNTIVLERKGLAIKEVCDQICNRSSINRVSTMYGITSEEVVACINTYVENMTLSENEDIEMSTSVSGDEILCDTIGITDGAFLSVLDFALQHNETLEVIDLNEVYATGIEMILFDCLLDIKSKDIHWVEVSDIHKIVLSAFEKANEPVTDKNIEFVLEQLGFNDKNKWGETIH